MRRAYAFGRISTFALVVALAGCTSNPDDATTTPSVEPSVAPVSSPSPTEEAPAFPIEAFADISENPVSKQEAAQFEAVLTDMAASNGAGMSATVMTANGTWSGATGSADGVRDVRVDSQFGIASITKSVIAAQVMQMVESGELSLDAPASDYLPANFEFDTNGATIRQLLEMLAGIPDWYGEHIEERMATHRRRDWTTAEVLALVGPHRSPADDEFLYTDTNYTLLGLVIEHVRRRPLVDVLRHGVLRVDGTERLVYQPAEAPTPPMAMPDGESRAAFEKGGGYLPSMSDASAAGPAGAIASDSPSLARWWRAFCAGEIVSQASLTEMWPFVDGPPGYGFGLYNPADPYAVVVGHTGQNFGYVSWAGCLLDEGAVVVVLSDVEFEDIGGMAEPLVEAILSTPPVPADDPTPAPTEPASSELVLYLRSFNPGYPAELAELAELAVYADGRVIWFAHEREGYLQLRLTPKGVERLRSKAMSTDLFEHDLALGIDPGWGHLEVRRGDLTVVVAWGRKPGAVSDLGMQDSFVAATPAQAGELIELEAFFRDPTAWGLPPHMYVRPQISPFVPTHLWVSFDRAVPDPSKLPSPARRVLTRVLDGGCGVISIVQAREIARAVIQAGLTPIGLYGERPFTHVRDGIAFNMPGEGSSVSFLHIHPSLPHESICD